MFWRRSLAHISYNFFCWYIWGTCPPPPPPPIPKSWLRYSLAYWWGACPLKKKKKKINSIQAYPYSTCRQVEISFLVCPRLHIFKSKNEKAPCRGRGGGRTPPSHTLPPLGRYAPSGLVASLPRKKLRPQMFWLITPLLTA